MKSEVFVGHSFVTEKGGGFRSKRSITDKK